MIQITVKYFTYDEKGIMRKDRETVVFNADEIKNLSNFKYLPSLGTLNSVLVDSQLNVWFQCSGWDGRQGGLYLKEWDGRHVKNLF